MAHQKDAVRRCWRAPAFALLAEARTGKTYVTLIKAAGHYERGEIDTLLVFARNGIHSEWIDTHVPAFFPDGVPYVAASYSSGYQRKDWKTAIAEPAGGRLRILAINLEAMAFKTGQAMVAALMKGRKVMAVVDESHRIATPKSKRTRAMWTVGKHAVVKMILSGTAVKKGFENLYAQYRFLDPDILGVRTYTEFKHTYCQIQSFGNFEKIVGYQNLDDLFAKMAPVTYQVLRRDCLDLPPIIPAREHVPLTDQQRDLYNQLRKSALAQLDTDQWMRVEGGGVKILRLQQVLCGIVTLDSGETTIIPTHRPQALLNILEKETEKGIVWCRFKEDVRIVMDTLREAKIGAVEHYGPTSERDRVLARKRFDEDDEVRVIVATTDTLCENYNLNVAGWMCFYSNHFKPDQRQQAVARNQASGQTKDKLVVYDLEVPKTVDSQIIAAQLRAESFAELLRDQRSMRAMLEQAPD